MLSPAITLSCWAHALSRHLTYINETNFTRRSTKKQHAHLALLARTVDGKFAAPCTPANEGMQRNWSSCGHSPPRHAAVLGLPPTNLFVSNSWKDFCLPKGPSLLHPVPQTQCVPRALPVCSCSLVTCDGRTQCTTAAADYPGGCRSVKGASGPSQLYPLHDAAPPALQLAITNGSLVQSLPPGQHPTTLRADLRAFLPALPSAPGLGDVSEDLVLSDERESRTGVGIQRQLAEQGRGLLSAVKEQ
eukprot:1145656-Pelagomonas_calceolata.AAC.2